MDELRFFAVSSVRKPPVELSRKKDKQTFTSRLTLPIPPQLLIFSQGQWTPGDKDVTVDIHLDAEKIGEMDKDTKCFAWETTSLKEHPAGDQIMLEIKVIGAEVPAEQSQAPKKKKGAMVKKAGKTSSPQEQKEKAGKTSSPQEQKEKAGKTSSPQEQKEKAGKTSSPQEQKEVQEKDPKPLADISKNINTDSEKTDVDLVSLKTEKSKSVKVTPKENGSASGKDKLEKKKKKIISAATADKKSTPPTTHAKKTRQTQLNFSGAKKVTATDETQEKEDGGCETSKNQNAAEPHNVGRKDEAGETKPHEAENKQDMSLKQTTETVLTDEGLCEARVLNESTPQMADIPSPLPRKQARKKRRRNDTENSPEGPTPKKRGTRMRALIGDGTPKSSRSKTVLSVSPFKENVMMPVESGEAAEHSEGQLTRCVDLSARAPRPSARWGHSMMLSRPRCAVLIGGQGDRQQLSKDSVWTLNTDTRKWQGEEVQSEGQKPENRMGHTATYDSTVRCIYIFGGSKNSRWFHDIHVYDLDENKWTLSKVQGKAPTRAYHTANLHRHELWIFGGVYPRPDPNPDGCSNEIHIFSPIMQTWYTPIVQGEKPAARSGHSATLIKDHLVMFGGWDAPFCYNDLFILDMTTVDWSRPDVKGTPPKPRSWHASCALTNERIMIHGGYDGNEALDDTFIFDLNGMSWSRLVVPSAPKARAGHTAVCVPYSHENQEEDEVLVFGGGDNDGEFFSDLISVAIPFRPVVELQ